MPKLYIEEYTRVLSGRHVYIACREGILRDYLKEIAADIKFLIRQGVRTTLFHNLPNRFANQKHVKHLQDRLPQTAIVRIPAQDDFYKSVLEYQDKMFKIIFLERKHLVDRQGAEINALNTKTARTALTSISQLIGNVNFRNALDYICTKIEAGTCDRVHILPAGKNAIKHELFTIEGSGTLIANDFSESFHSLVSDEELDIVYTILDTVQKQGYLKPRTKSYLQKHRGNFYITRIDGIVVGCVEKKIIDETTAEMGALVIATRFRNQRVGVYTIEAFLAEMQKQGYTRIISLTNNPKLQRLYKRYGFKRCSAGAYKKRQLQSPGVAMFYLALTSTRT